MGLIRAPAPARPRIRPGSAAFSALLGLLAALPTFGIDMILPSLSDTATALHVPATAMGAAMGVYLLGFGGALLVYGPVSDRLGRKPAIVCGCLLLVVGSLGCGAARTLPDFLLFRALQGIGAAGPGMAVLAMVRDLFEGEAARARVSFVVLTINVVPMMAPTIGAGLMDLGGWRLIHAAPVAAALAALVAIRHIDEPLQRAAGPGPASGILRGYGRILASRVFLGHALCNAAAAGAVFAYITGSALVFIDALGLSPLAYGLVFGASSLSVMVGAFLNGRLAARGVPPPRVIAAGLVLATGAASLLLVAALARPPAAAPVVAAMVGVALAFGLVSPNAVHGATERDPAAAGAASAVAVFLQMLAAAVASDLVARFFDGRSALSMAAVMLGCSLAAAAAHAGLARPAPRAPSRPYGEPACSSIRPPWQPLHLTRDGGRLAHIEAGPLTPEGQPLLLINGWTGDHGIFTPQIRHFSRTRRVVAVDLRGHGASDAPERDYTVAGFAEDVAWQSRTLGLVKPIVIGHSFGGAVALELCGRHPDLAAGLVMIDSIVLPSADAAGGAAIEGLLAGVGGPDYRSVVREMAWAIGGAYDHPARRKAIFETFILGPCQRTPQHVAHAALRDMVLAHDPVPAARACRVPMAYISADVPLVAAARDLDRLRELCPQLVTAQTLLAGHFNTIEVAEQVNAMIERFLAVGLRPRAR